MQIRMIDKSQILIGSRDMNTIKIRNNRPQDEIIILDDGTFQYYKAIHESLEHGETIAVRTPDFGGVSAVMAHVFAELFKSYRETGDFDLTLKAFPGVTREMLESYIAQAIDRVKKHKKIDDKDVRILTHLLVYNGSKKELVDRGICTLYDIRNTYCEFAAEYEWCYGFKKPCIKHRMDQFDAGECAFCYTIEQFAAKHDIAPEALHKLVQQVLDVAVNMQIADDEYCKRIMSDIVQGREFNAQDKEQMVNLVRRLKEEIAEKEKTIYKEYANELIKSNKIHVNDLMNRCVEKGIDYWKLSRALRNNGVVPAHHTKKHVL